MQIEILNKHLFLTSKPVIYLVNLSDKDFIRKKNKWLIKIKEYVDKNDPGSIIIPFSGAFEQKLAEFELDGERAAYIVETKCASALDKIIVTGYKALQLEYFFTAGADEVKAWTIQVNKLFLFKKISEFYIFVSLCRKEQKHRQRLAVFIPISRRVSSWPKLCILPISKRRVPRRRPKQPESIDNRDETIRSKMVTSFSLRPTQAVA